MQIIEKPIGELVPYESNPRKNDNAVDAVAASIQEFGFRVPVIIDVEGIIIAGHTRYKAALQLSMEAIPCIIVDDLYPEQIRAFRLADNKLAELATWDTDLLAQELADIEIDMAAFGFDIDLLTPKLEAIEDDFDFDVPAEPKAKPGDIYTLGRHRLMCGDSTNENTVTSLMDSQLADMLLTDPPYNVDYEGLAGKIENDSLSAKEYGKFLVSALTAADRIMKNGAAFYIWHASSQGHTLYTACAEIGWEVRQCLIWQKNHFVLGHQDYQWKHEPCLYGWKSGAPHYFVNDRTQTTILHEDKPLTSVLHPTMKPVPLLARLIHNSSRTQENVLDLFGGSGSTLIACEQLNRSCFMMESDPQYVDVIINRWEEFTGEKAMQIK